MSESNPAINSFTVVALEQLRQKTFLDQIDYHAELDSTNNRAVQLCQQTGQQENLQTPLLCLTERQTSGRGRGKNQWWAQQGSLTFSVVLDTRQFSSREQLPLLSLATGWAVSSVLSEYVSSAMVSLKWPNDVYLGNRKVCGILTETAGPRYVVAGIGLNVNNSFANAPGQLQSIATSLFDETGQEQALLVVLEKLLKQLEKEWGQLAAGETAFIQNWPQRCLLAGRIVTHQAGETRTTGYCQGIDETGALLLQTDRNLHRLIGGTIVDF